MTSQPPLVLALPDQADQPDQAADLDLVGGKGASLARLAATGLPVPRGFHVTTAAYRDLVARDGLQDEILAAIGGVRTGDADTAEAAARRIAGLFAQHPVPDRTAAAVRQAYAGLGAEVPVAVRSSATAEDLPGLSFAGQQDSYLNVRGEQALLDAIKRCWASLWTARAIDYRARHRIAAADVAIAVVVQELVPADAAGVVFTANPVTGARDEMVINAGWGLGEAVVGGQTTPDTYRVARSDGRIRERRIGAKAVRTVLTAAGTGEEPVPTDDRTRPVLDAAEIAELARLGIRIEQLYGRPMDVEWARQRGRFAILQARPVTGLPAGPAEEWNDSRAGDYLWTCANLGEAIPSVMTPCTWSLVQIFMSEAMALSAVGRHRLSGNIGGRFYLNLSLTLAVGSALGLSRLVRQASEQAFGRIPDDVEVPSLPMARRRVVWLAVASAVPFLRRVVSYQKRLPALLAAAPGRCDRLRTAIGSTPDRQGLLALWHAELDPLLRDVSRMLAAGARLAGTGLSTIRPRLLKLVPEREASALLTGLHTSTGQLASLGPLLGLAQLARGEIDRATYARRWGHRCPDEFEISVPRPAEDPDWIDRQVAGLRAAGTDISALLARQETARTAAWQRFGERYPRKEAAMRRRIARIGRAARAREAARSEVIRAFWVLRAFVLRAGELTGQHSDLFFLTIEEILALLAGDDTALARVLSRREAYRRYAALPSYPTLIRGRFDPFRWAADPRRRSDLFDEHRDRRHAEGGAADRGRAPSRGPAPASDTISGFPGATGIVEATARVLGSVDEGAALRPGEVLVTTVTNIGWTPLFARAAAVVTDIGAPLSHAAIVARELGIPAVVGCGTATTRLHTGDRLRVDGEHGTVQIINVDGVDGTDGTDGTDGGAKRDGP